MEAAGVVRVWWVIAFAFCDLLLCLVVLVLVLLVLVLAVSHLPFRGCCSSEVDLSESKTLRQSLAEAQSSRNGFCLRWLLIAP
ncbi:hypothetical protein MUK42_35337 [Musa troglodytarum]|uniref:Uncharacterized protein n=1 Tax=Musa troglodytarum TaxID=320322 RepID=A0A9E7E8S5_9LILI|nr:hypothetical protein MUK42_35337 [Musa troglodytarum]